MSNDAGTPGGRSIASSSTGPPSGGARRTGREGAAAPILPQAGAAARPLRRQPPPAPSPHGRRRALHEEPRPRRRSHPWSPSFDRPVFGDRRTGVVGCTSAGERRAGRGIGQTAPMSLPDPALVVLVGASGSGKSTWAVQHYRADEVVSSDALRGVVGSGPHDLDASADAFAVLESVVTARLGRRLTTVVDTLGFDPGRRRGWLSQARAARLPAVAVSSRRPTRSVGAATPRDRPCPPRPWPASSPAAGRWRPRWPTRAGTSSCRSRPTPGRPALPPLPPPAGARERAHGIHRGGGAAPGLPLPVGRGPDGLAARCRARRGRGRLRRAWHSWTTSSRSRRWAGRGTRSPSRGSRSARVAALGTGLRLGTLCTPVTFRQPGITAKAAATLSALNGGRVFLGIGAGWWEREHAAYALPFPPAASGWMTWSAPSASCGRCGRRGRRRTPDGVFSPRDHLLPAARRPGPGDRRRRG